jgi:hypothetical protein
MYATSAVKDPTSPSTSNLIDQASTQNDNFKAKLSPTSKSRHSVIPWHRECTFYPLAIVYTQLTQLQSHQVPTASYTPKTNDYHCLYTTQAPQDHQAIAWSHCIHTSLPIACIQWQTHRIQESIYVVAMFSYGKSSRNHRLSRIA